MLNSLTRKRAFIYHLTLSALVVGIVCVAIFGVWYPQPYFEIAGAWSVLQILIGVDVILGPALTLILFKPGKRGLMFDIAVIASIQLVALIYGTTVIYQERPQYLVFSIDRFEVLANSEIDPQSITNPEIARNPSGGPIRAVAKLPESVAERQQVLHEVLDGKPDIDRRPEFWHAYDANIDVIVKASKTIDQFAAQRPDAQLEIDAFLAGRTDQHNLMVAPVVGKRESFVFVIDRSTALPVGIIDTDPWGPPPSS